MALLGRRLGVDLPEPPQKKQDPLARTFQLLLDVEGVRVDNIRRFMQYGIPPAVANEALPAPIEWTPLVVDNLPDELPVEPLVRSVPKECFYLRFGTWNNQIWLRRLTEDYGGDLGRMISLRGFKAKIQSKFLDQLTIQSTEFDRLFGGQLIDDVGVIGMDTYFDSGSAVGIMLHARGTKALKNNLTNKRAKFAKEHEADGATIEERTYRDVEYTALLTPDNRYRSFYVVDEDNHLMTTSERMAQRFIEASKGEGSLADTEEFQFARYNMPLDRNDTLFVYMPTGFLQNLLSPHYQIEMRRRNESVTDMMLLQMAKLGATSEGVADLSERNLIAKGYLPTGFGGRPDGSRVAMVGDEWHDSRRGRRGFFTPIPDMVLGDVTWDESAWFTERATFFADNIKSLDPMSVGVTRFERESGVERVVFDARILPFGEDKYRWLLSMLGQPLKQEIATSPNDIVKFQASLEGGEYSPNTPPHQVFAAIEDHVDPNLDLQSANTIGVMETIKQTPGYLGAWPSPGYVDWLPRLGGAPDSLGYTHSRLLGLWRLQWKDFSVLSFDQRRLEDLKSHLKVVPSERPAQVRLEVGDLARSKISGWANTVNYRRSWQTSIANVKLLNMLTQQFGVPVDQAMETAERLLNVELVCSLGGEYEVIELDSGRKLWQSTKWPSFTNPQLPPSYKAPVLNWFRGLQAEVVKGQTQFSIHGYLDIERLNPQPALPAFDLFKGFGNMFGK